MSVDKSMKVLVVDDSGFMRKIFVKGLKDLGFSNIIDATDGVDAISKLKADGNVGLVISDWNMPKLDGLNLLKWLRKNSDYQSTPFIMATAQGDKAKVNEAMEAGANGHVAKPFQNDLLMEKINIAFGVEIVKEKTEPRKQNIVKGKVQMKMGHIQITDHLVLGVIKHQIETGQIEPRYFDLETIKMPGWNPIQSSLEKDEIDGSFVLAPIAMDLFSYNVPINLTMFAHRNGSIFVRSKNYELEQDGSIEDIYYEHVVNIPHKMSVHNMLAHKFLTGLGLSPGVPGTDKDINVRFEVVPPIQMPTIMRDNEEVSGFIVAEPLGSKAIAMGIAELQFLSSSIWEDHPCCVTAFQESFIKKYPDAVYEFSSMMVKAGKFIEDNKDEAAKIAVKFLDPDGNLGLKVPVLEKVLNQIGGITMDNLYPTKEDLDKMQRYMHDKMDIGQLIDLDKFVDTRFADIVCQ